jgi:hypothetical protein
VLYLKGIDIGKIVLDMNKCHWISFLYENDPCAYYERNNGFGGLARPESQDDG